ncbi:MAG: RNA chaperone Hfq [Terriglobales bacterium]
MEKPAQNIQDSFLNSARKEKQAITIYLLSGVKLTGRIRSFDKYCLVLETSSQEQMIFKHAISTVVLQRGSGHEHFERRPATATRPEVETSGQTAAAAASDAGEES